jgi:chromosome segregation ATPase
MQTLQAGVRQFATDIESQFHKIGTEILEIRVGVQRNSVDISEIRKEINQNTGQIAEIRRGMQQQDARLSAVEDINRQLELIAAALKKRLQRLEGSVAETQEDQEVLGDELKRLAREFREGLTTTRQAFAGFNEGIADAADGLIVIHEALANLESEPASDHLDILSGSPLGSDRQKARRSGK